MINLMGCILVTCYLSSMVAIMVRIGFPDQLGKAIDGAFSLVLQEDKERFLLADFLLMQDHDVMAEVGEHRKEVATCI